jgi:hypothetical protein
MKMRVASASHSVVWYLVLAGLLIFAAVLFLSRPAAQTPPVPSETPAAGTAPTAR